MENDTSATAERVCIIGAGVSGLATAKVFLEDGFDVQIFEKQSDLGGTWHPDRTYPGLRTNDVGDIYRFPDLPYPESADEYPTAEQVRDYMNDYADRFDLRPHMRFNTEVRSVERADEKTDDSIRGFRVTTARGGQPEKVRNYDYVVVCNGVFSDPHVPHFEGEDRFDGRILHSNEVRSRDRLQGQRVVVIGGGKSAYDIAEAAGRHASESTLVFRSAHWLVPRYLMGLRADWLVLTRFAQAFLPYHTKKGLSARLHSTGKPLIDLYWRFMTWFLKRIIDIPDGLEPQVSLPIGFQDIGSGIELYDLVRSGQVSSKRAEIDCFIDGETIRLNTGESIAADLVVCATGWDQTIDFLSPGLRDAVRDDDGFFTLYRHILPPEERRLGFIGYATSIGTSLSSEVAANWLATHFREQMKLPEDDQMYKEIDKVKKWAARYLPRESSGHAVAGYLIDYLDQLLRDMDLSVHRADNWFTEYFGRIHADRFEGLGEARRSRAQAS
jgi:cation diffusion facilitator CzcD-associated flavoprotein CzcO